MSFYQRVQDFQKYLSILGRSKATITTYRKQLRFFEEYLKREEYPTEVKEIPITALENYLYSMIEQELAPATVKLALSTIKSFYSYLEKRGVITENITKAIDPIKTTPKEAMYLTEEEIKLLTEKIQSPLLGTIVKTLYYTGLRIGELVNLEIGNIDLENKKIKVINGKGGKNRSIPINKTLNKVLKSHIGKEKYGLLFKTERSGKITPQYINQVLKEAAKEAGIMKKVSAHTLRHSFASTLVKKKVQLTLVQKLLGHQDLRITSRYLHANLDDLQAAVETLN